MKKPVKIILCSLLAVLLLATGTMVGFVVYTSSLTSDGDYARKDLSDGSYSFMGTRFIAHRGYSDAYFQNTEESFRMAGKETFFWGIETDVRVTKDGKYVCCHDNNPFVDKKKKISEMSYVEVLSTPLNPDKKGNAEPDGERFVCPFETYLQVCMESNKVAVIELKDNSFSQEQVGEIVAIGEKYLPKNRVVYICFKKKLLDYVEEKDGEYVTQYLTETTAVDVWFNLLIGENVSAKGRLAQKSLVDLAHKKNSLFAVWTVNDEEQAEKFASWGVDYITTNKVLSLSV